MIAASVACIAVLGSVLASRYDSHLAGALVAVPENLRELARSSLGGALGVAARTGDAGLGLAAKHAYTDAMRVALTIGACVAFVAAVLVGRVLPQRPAPSEEQARHGGHEVDVDDTVEAGEDPADAGVTT